MVELASGKREIIRWCDESGTYGTVPASGFVTEKEGRITPNYVQEWEPISGTGSDEITRDYEAGVQDVRFTLEYAPNDWRFLVLGIGKATNTDEGDGTYTHTFGYKTAKDLESFSLQRVESLSTSIVKTYKGSKINSFRIGWNAGGGGTGKFVRCSADCVAKEVASDVAEKSEEASPNTNSLLQSRQVVVTIGGSSYTRCLSGEININNNLSDGFYADATATTSRSETEPQLRTVEGSITLHYTDKTLFDEWVGGSAVSGTNSVEFRRTATTDTTTFTFTNFRIRGIPNETNLDGLNTVTLNFVADDVSIVSRDDRNDYYSTA